MIKDGRLTKLKLKLADDSIQEWECGTRRIENDRLSSNVPKENPEFMRYFQEGKEIDVRIYTPSEIAVFKSIIIDSFPEFVIEYDDEYSDVERRGFTRAYYDTTIF